MKDKFVTCPYCDGEGGRDIGVPCSPSDAMWFDDGEFMEIGFEECKKCKGKGKIKAKDKKDAK